MSYLLITPEMLEKGYLYFNGRSRENRKFEIVQHLDDGNYLVVDPYDDMLQHRAIAADEIGVEDATPIP